MMTLITRVLGVISLLATFAKSQVRMFGDDHVLVKEGNAVMILDMKTQALLKTSAIPELDCGIRGLDFDPCEQILVWSCENGDVYSHNLFTSEQIGRATGRGDLRSITIRDGFGAYYMSFENIGWRVYPFDYQNCAVMTLAGLCNIRRSCVWDGTACSLNSGAEIASMRAAKPEGGGIAVEGSSVWMSWSEFDSSGVASTPVGSNTIPVKNDPSITSFDTNEGDPSYILSTENTDVLIYYASITDTSTVLMRLLQDSTTVEVLATNLPAFYTPGNGKTIRQPAFAIGSLTATDDTIIFASGTELMYQSVSGGAAESKYSGTEAIGPILRYKSCTLVIPETDAPPTAIPTPVPATIAPTTVPTRVPLPPGDTYSPGGSTSPSSSTTAPTSVPGAAGTTPIPPSTVASPTSQPPGSPTQLPAGSTQLPAGSTQLPAGSTQLPAGSTSSPSSVSQPAASPDDGFPVIHIILIVAAVVVTCCVLAVIWFFTRVKQKKDVMEKQRELGGDISEDASGGSYHPLNPIQSKEERSINKILAAPPVFDMTESRKRNSNRLEASRALKQLRHGGHIGDDGSPVQDTEKVREIDTMKRELRLVMENGFTDEAVDTWKHEQSTSDVRTQSSNRRSLPRVADHNSSLGSPFETNSQFPFPESLPPTPGDELPRSRQFRSSTTVGTPRTPFAAGSRRPVPTTPRTPMTPYTTGSNPAQRIMT